jgi:hypothetical protein
VRPSACLPASCPWPRRPWRSNPAAATLCRLLPRGYELSDQPETKKRSTNWLVWQWGKRESGVILASLLRHLWDYWRTVNA